MYNGPAEKGAAHRQYSDICREGAQTKLGAPLMICCAGGREGSDCCSVGSEGGESCGGSDSCAGGSGSEVSLEGAHIGGIEATSATTPEGGPTGSLDWLEDWECCQERGVVQGPYYQAVRRGAAVRRS